MSTKILKWSGDKSNFTFAVDASEVKLFSDMKIVGECKTEDKDENGKGVKKFKATKPFKVTLNAMLYATLGVDVKDTAITMVKRAHEGKSGCLYMGGKKLFKAKMVLTKAQVSDVEILQNGTWVSCKVELQFEEGKGGSGSGKNSKNKNNKKKYYGYCKWTNGGWFVIAGTPANANLYTTDVTIGKKLYHGYKPTTQPANNDSNYDSNRDYTNGLPNSTPATNPNTHHINH